MTKDSSTAVAVAAVAATIGLILAVRWDNLSNKEEPLEKRVKRVKRVKQLSTYDGKGRNHRLATQRSPVARAMAAFGTRNQEATDFRLLEAHFRRGGKATDAEGMSFRSQHRDTYEQFQHLGPAIADSPGAGVGVSEPRATVGTVQAQTTDVGVVAMERRHTHIQTSEGPIPFN